MLCVCGLYSIFRPDVVLVGKWCVLKLVRRLSQPPWHVIIAERCFFLLQGARLSEFADKSSYYARNNFQTVDKVDVAHSLSAIAIAN